ncbi:hypothetical protein WN944_022436 [Citrus x changshan-huyou]|uniref:Leucine-rich repeat-containing N-terminal plant-type domain-containing protein n=1 Tax=Citrus x changshan-huyou TaxID=2935761 RepID=A0AAP0N4J0_9ROSI
MGFENNSHNPAETPQFPYAANVVVRSQLKCEANISSSIISLVVDAERIALLEIKSFFISASDVGYDDDILSSWFDDDGMSSDCCNDWEGVKCNATTRRVTQLSLNQKTKINYSDYNSYSYGVSLLTYDSFGSLKQLKILNLGGNFNNIFEYTNFTYLNLRSNNIEGSTIKQGLAYIFDKLESNWSSLLWNNYTSRYSATITPSYLVS